MRLVRLGRGALLATALAACAHGPAAPRVPPRPAPGSLEELIAAAPYEGRGHIAEWKESIRPYVGAAIDWDLISWSGEMTTDPNGYDTPDRHLGTVRHRVRFVSPLIHGDLSEVSEKRSVLVTCAAAFDREEGTEALVQRRGPPRPERGMGPVRLRGRIWGARGENGYPNLWIEDCETLAPR